MIHNKVTKSPSMAFLLHGKKKAWFLLSLHNRAGQRDCTCSARRGRHMDVSHEINNLRCKPLICAPIRGRVDNFLQSYHS